MYWKEEKTGKEKTQPIVHSPIRWASGAESVAPLSLSLFSCTMGVILTYLQGVVCMKQMA